jgi:hypothetical protein
MTAFAATRRLVVKTGSALIVDDSGGIRTAWLAGLADDVAMLKKRGIEMVVVTSGAIAVGRWKLGYGKRVLKIEEKQAAAATGQVWLAHAWLEALAARGLVGAQVLLTPDDTEARRRHLNARATVAMATASTPPSRPSTARKMASRAAAYCSGEAARKPVATPSRGRTMSARGPPESCATVSTPAAIISTTPIPKCSFHIVCRPAVAAPSAARSSARGMFTRNSTAPGGSASSGEAASERSAASRDASPSSRQPPMRRSRTEP